LANATWLYAEFDKNFLTNAIKSLDFCQDEQGLASSETKTCKIC